MNRKIIILLIIGSIVYLAGMQEAVSRSNFLSAFEKNYPGSTATRIDECMLCHSENPNTGDESLNPYGKAYRSSGNFTAIESPDSDNDGYTNIAEINNLAFPGDSNDKPIISTTPVETPATPAMTPVPPVSSAFTTVEKTPGFGMLLAVFALLAIYSGKKKPNK